MSSLKIRLSLWNLRLESNPKERPERKCIRNGDSIVSRRVSLTLISLYIRIRTLTKKEETILHRAHHIHTHDKQAPIHFPLPSS